MGRGGNNRKPTQLKVLKGTARPSRENPKEPKLPPGVPACPDHLDEEAKREWFRVVPSLSGAGVLTRVDHALLAAYCQSYSRWVWAETDLAEGTGLYTKSDAGREYIRASVKIAQESMAQMKAFACEYGLTPVSRARVSTNAPEKKGDDWEDL